MSFHDVLYLDFPHLATPMRRLQFRLLGGMTVAAARHVITVSDYAKQRIMHHFRVPEHRISIIHDPLDVAWHEPDHNAIDAAWRRLQARLPARYLLGVGRLEPRKNVVKSAAIAQSLRAEGLTDGLVWVGPDDFGTPMIERELRERGLREIVTRVSGLSTVELQAVYQHAQALLFLSLAEGFGYPAIESMAMGTPAIVSNRTAMPEVAGDAAALVDPDDDLAIAAAARAALSDLAYRARLVAAGYRQSARYQPDVAAAQTAAVYERAAPAP